MINVIENLKTKFDLKKPSALTWDEWQEWKKKTKTERPFVFFVKETLPKYYDDVVYYTTLPYDTFRNFIRSRITQRWHMVNTGLKPGYHEISERMLHANFNLLTDFVEVEQAWMQVLWGKDKEERNKFPWWSLNPTRFSSFRNPEAGLKYLEWETSVLMDKNYTKNKKDWGKPTPQAKNAMEIIKLYKWWKNRINRVDPYDASGWNELCAERRAGGHGLFSDKGITEDFKKREKVALNKLRKLEEKYSKEDESMLIRLIKIRESLWT